jgi:FAD:protein FMN transferase
VISAPGARTRTRANAPVLRVFASLRPLVFLPLLPLLAGCALFDPAPASVSFETMGTQAVLTLAGPEARQLPEAERRVKEVMARLESELSVYQPDSAVSRLNRLAGIEPTEVPEATRRLLDLSRRYGDLTGGAFDVTVGPLLQLWRLGRQRPDSPPDESAIAETLALVDYRQIRLADRTAFLPHAGMSVDFGAIGKGHAVDAAWEECRRLGASNFMIDLGGNIRVAGQASRGTDWNIGIRNPFERNKTIAQVRISPGRAVATSGQYERFVEIEGRRYGHIIDPRTGYPASGLAAVTVLAPEAVTADALSTSLFVLDLEASLTVLQNAHAEALFIPDKEPLELWATPGLASHLVTSTPVIWVGQ